MPAHRSRPVLRALVIGGALFALGSSLGSVSEAAASCPDGARCGAVTVPADRLHPGGATIDIAYAVLPRTEAGRPSLGTVVPNPGGPGVSTIGQADLYRTVLARLRRHRELLLIDVRGTGRSAALRCPGLAAINPLLATTEAVGSVCALDLGGRAGLFGSAAAADDIDAVRAELGLGKLDLWGDSYGTYLMSVYAARHPEHVRSIVLDGAFPIAFDVWGRDVLTGTRRSLSLVCRRTHSCSGPRVLAQIAELAARLRHKPLAYTAQAPTGPVRVVSGERDLAALTHAGGDPTIYGQLPAAVDAALRGRTALLERLLGEQRLADAGTTGIDPTLFSLGAAAAVSCHDYPRAFGLADPPAKRRADYDRALAAIPAADFFPFSAQAWLATDIDAGPKCLDWPADPTAGSAVAGLDMPDVPVLVQSGDLDSNTPVEQGRAAAAQFPNATFAIVGNAGHTPDLQPCGAAMAIRFVERLNVDSGACRHAGAPPKVTRWPAGMAGRATARRRLR